MLYKVIVLYIKSKIVENLCSEGTRSKKDGHKVKLVRALKHETTRLKKQTVNDLRKWTAQSFKTKTPTSIVYEA